MITLTANAAEVVRGDINKEKLPAGTALRLGVVNDGCKDSNTQYRYVLELDSEAVRPGDHLFESEGITIRVDQQSLAHLDELHEPRVFVFAQPLLAYGTDAIPLRVLAFEGTSDRASHS